MKDYFFVIWLIVVIFGILSFMFAPMILEKRWNRERDKERAERRKEANDKLAELFPLALEEMKKKWKEIFDDNVLTDAHGTRCRFYYRGFYFYVFVNDYGLAEIHRDGEKVGTIAFDNVETYVGTFAELFYDVDGIIERAERVMNRLAQKLMNFHGRDCEWKFVKDITCNIERKKVLEKDGHHLTLTVWEKYVLAKVEKDGKVWANYCAKVDEATDLFDAMNKVFEKIVQWEEFM